jgi:hypothetical protein
MFQNVSDILKSFSIKQRLTVLVLLLLTITASIFIKSYFTKADLTPIQTQLNQCITSQGSLVNQNADLVIKTKDLTEGYLKIDSMLRHIKPDTVFIVKTEQPTLHTEALAINKNLNDSSVAMISYPTIVEEAVRIPTNLKVIKNGNATDVMKAVQLIIKNKTKIP